MDRKFYCDAVDRMQKANVDPEYVQGWVGGYMGNPKREEQRITRELVFGQGSWILVFAGIHCLLR